MSYLALTEVLHFSIALVLFLGFLRSYKWWVAAFALVFGFFIDADHLFDYGYYLVKFKQPFRLAEFLSTGMFGRTGKIFVPLHAWELVVVLLLFSLIFRLGRFKASRWKLLSQILLVSGVALAAHVLTDFFTNNMSFLSYSLIWRWINGFDVWVVCGG